MTEHSVPSGTARLSADFRPLAAELAVEFCGEIADARYRAHVEEEFFDALFEAAHAVEPEPYRLWAQDRAAQAAEDAADARAGR